MYLPLHWRETKEGHAVEKDNPGRVIQGHAGLHDLGLAADDAEVAVAGAQSVGELEEVAITLLVMHRVVWIGQYIRQNSRRLKCLENVLDDVGPLADDTEKVDSHGLSKERHIGRGNLLSRQASLASDGA